MKKAIIIFVCCLALGLVSDVQAQVSYGSTPRNRYEFEQKTQALLNKIDRILDQTQSYGQYQQTAPTRSTTYTRTTVTPPPPVQYTQPYASETSPIEREVTVGPSVLTEPSAFNVGLESYYYEIKSGLFENDGAFYGVYGDYTYRPETVAMMVKGEGRFAYGQVDHTAYDSGTLDEIDQYTFEVRGLIGPEFELSQSTRVTPYSGIGFRYLNDDSSGMITTTTLIKGYERESEYLYVPIGIEVANALGQNWQVGLNLEYDHLLEGQQTRELARVEVEQDEGYGVRGSLKFVKKGETLDFIIEPFIRYWDIDQSEIALVSGVPIFEPANTTTESGVKLGVLF